MGNYGCLQVTALLDYLIDGECPSPLHQSDDTATLRLEGCLVKRLNPRLPVSPNGCKALMILWKGMLTVDCGEVVGKYGTSDPTG